VLTKIARFMKKVITLPQKAVVGNPKPALLRGHGGYADWVIVSIHGLKTSLDLPYRRLLDVLHEMPLICRFLDLEPFELPDFTLSLSSAASSSENWLSDAISSATFNR